MAKTYNIRVYGLLINSKDEVLVSDEFRMGMRMTKFPGGGLELGEGLIACLKREWQEELNAIIEIKNHFYTTDMYVKSAFNKEQLISVYYLVELKKKLQITISEVPFDYQIENEGAQSFRWLAIKEMTPESFTFPLDKLVAAMLQSKS